MFVPGYQKNHNATQQVSKQGGNALVSQYYDQMRQALNTQALAVSAKQTVRRESRLA
jgi:hypothetical protein